jgi:2-hydroxychromene-2-carboxylate isomerase
MAEKILSFYFDYISPYAYLAWHRLQTFAPEHGLRVAVQPTLFAALLNAHGHKGPGEIAPKRAYMFKDCTRLAAGLGLPFEPPASHPFNPLPSLRASLLDMEEATRAKLVTRLFAATWAERRDVGSLEVVAELCAGIGIADAADRIAEPSVKRRLREATERAIEIGVFGVPTFVVDTELFWGNDSFPHLERFLAGKDPVPPDDAERWARVEASAER